MILIIRSRGIRLIKEADHTVSEQMKVYYDPEENVYAENPRIQELTDSKLLTYFEYSRMENGIIDTYNYHVNLMSEGTQLLYTQLDACELEVIRRIPVIFDRSFQNYTVGYKIADHRITGQSYYFYPTVKRDTRYGIRGITDRSIVSNEVERFAKFISHHKKDETYYEVTQFGQLMNKLKGISVHISKSKNGAGYKLYGRVDQHILEKFLSDKLGFDVSKYRKYGEIVLVSQRIQENSVKGYNIYFIS